MKHLLSGNEAFARGLYEAGCTLAVGYPGTPSTEILENVAKSYKSDVRCEWAPNEKVALEVAAGAAMAGARTVVTMKHVGLNVAMDPLMTLTETGTPGGFVLIVADDPGMHSSQNEQDTRMLARFAKVPVFEPSDSAEAKDFLKKAFVISEKYNTPVILRSNTRVSHSRSMVTFEERVVPERPIGFEKNPRQFVVLPMNARRLHPEQEARVLKMEKEGSVLRGRNAWHLNKIDEGTKKLGIITESVAYQYVKEAFPEASVLKLGCAYPVPRKLIEDFCKSVRKVLVVEELEDFTELNVKAMGLKCEGKSVIPRCGELSSDILREARAKLEGKKYVPAKHCKAKISEPLPMRPPTLCAGCPHRGVFYALTKIDCDVTGDIGCYTLGYMPPLSKMDTVICMGAGVSMAHGMSQTGQKRPVVGIVGDSTFFHSGITGVLNVAWNKAKATIVVLDNRITAMTGHQDNPGTGLTLMGEETVAASIEEICKACGIKNVAVVDPLNYVETLDALKKATSSDEPWVVISRSPCVLKQRRRTGPVRRIDATRCKACKACLALGCPSIEFTGGKPHINALVCNGCSLCTQVCKFNAIEEEVQP
ncbi:MAG: indolepyruvate ferredoxin oxidoreductase subunit alpha [Planctomycetia bacterium]|nr:indolepyruvate ferredoxin oxidoreductase subunit alpha [Planctomycetia bacterium]